MQNCQRQNQQQLATLTWSTGNEGRTITTTSSGTIDGDFLPEHQDDAGQRQMQQQQRARSHSLMRRPSISLNAVINHRRALLGALLNGVGSSNLSLPSCLPQERDCLTSTETVANTRGSIIAAATASASIPSNSSSIRATHKPVILQLGNPLPFNNAGVHKGRDAVASASSVVLTSTSNHHHNEANDQTIASSLTSSSSRSQLAELTSSLSTLYMNLLVVVGVAVPVTASVSEQVPASLDQGFYLYLYLGSVAFVITMYGTLLRDKALKKMIVKHVKQENTYTFDACGTYVQTFQNLSGCKCVEQQIHHQEQHKRRRRMEPFKQYGSFCLRLGTVGFGAGSLVFTGLQISAEVSSGEPGSAIVPAARLLLTTAQMHFIFLNSRDLVLTRHEALAKIGLMHLIATNICEWLQALVEETRYEIVQLERSLEEEQRDIHRKLLRDASPFLFPCTIEFSLICAVLLFEMWKSVHEPRRRSPDSLATRSRHQLSIDCASAHRGLFGGILVIACTVLSLIMFFVLREAKPKMAIEQVTSLEFAIHTSGTIAAIGGALKMRHLEYRNTKPPHLDSTLLAAAQAGVYLHTLFGAVGSILTQGPTWVICLAADSLALLQSTIQTILIKIAWRRRSRSDEKPGKELITFLIVNNIAMWTVNTLEKSRAGVRPDHLEFFGVWAWTIITHVSMPLAIFYRFHSAICLFEVWKSCYKFRPKS
ncbi:hypothetical protein QAD02_006646 [Eretmocerus hayati]|uniref:Uncharacterized protein n=1 Tax=Eretmocerus hayati TaxID=131215 RepID=A0ACC2N3U5_9HYME|nr:hypothetical protein QAD02_006646 [Eretmocerus hayati]